MVILVNQNRVRVAKSVLYFFFLFNVGFQADLTFFVLLFLNCARGRTMELSRLEVVITSICLGEIKRSEPLVTRFCHQLKTQDFQSEILSGQVRPTTCEYDILEFICRHFFLFDFTIITMCKEERRCQSLKRGITLHLSMILKKVNLLNFFSKA